MYDWLPDALGDNATVVTANRRVARVLRREFGQRQVADGVSAWLSPDIMSWHDWLSNLVDSARLHGDVPTRISSQQAALLWERCLRSEMQESVDNIGSLVRLSSEAWSRSCEWGLSLDDCRRFAHNADQRLFAAAARRYVSLLARNGWTDDAGRLDLVRSLFRDGLLSAPDRIALVGFDRIVPSAQRFLDELESAGTRVSQIRPSSGARAQSIRTFETTAAELRAAGAFARRRLQRDPTCRIAIITSGLDQQAERYRRLVLEGLAPGWQYGTPSLSAALNVSYGRNLAAFPAISAALLALRWVGADLSARDVSLLLRSPFIGKHGTAGRTRLELRLRQLPDRAWSPLLIARALGSREESKDASDWISRVTTLAEQRRKRPRTASPSEWAEWIDWLLRQLNWPGEAILDSAEHQLVNRWRELLNDLARLEIVSPEMGYPQALGRLSSLAKETVFQPESENAVVHLLGPLEAAGMEFDELWLSGLTASDWPPAGRPSPLLSRRLQRQYGLPDANPGDTGDFARRVLQRLLDSAQVVHCSYPRTSGDAEQTATTLLGELEITVDGQQTPWHASQLLAHCRLTRVEADPVPPVTDDETVAGGATTVQRQLGNPFAAFVTGRLAVRYLPLIAPGLAANLRGNLVHDALQSLYADRPSQASMRAWTAEQLQERITAATRAAFSRLERDADAVLKRLLLLERQRVQQLLRGVVRLDLEREAFQVQSVEGRDDTVLGGVRLSLRHDRMDTLESGGRVIIDYKTGAKKRFLDSDGVPHDYQLVVYACALNEDVSGLALFNIDSRDISIDGAGEAFNDDEDWHRRLGGWKAEVRGAIDSIRRGDVRVNARQGINDARPYALLSRFAELRRDG